MIAGTLEIQLLANMARLQKDMDQAKRTVSGTVDAMNRVLGTIGVGVSLAGIASMIKSVVDTGDRLNDLRKITGLTVNELGGLDKQAKLNGTNLDSVARAIGVMSKNMYAGVDAFKLLGIATKDADGNLRNANQVLLDVADRFSRMQDGAQKSALANQIFGKSGRELIPMLNEGRTALLAAAEAHLLNSGHTDKTAEASDRFNDILVILNGNVTATKTNFVNGLTPALNDIGNAFLKATGSASAFHAIGQGVGIVLKGVVIAVRVVHDALQSFGFAVDGIIKQFVALINLDYKKAIDIGNQYFANIDKNAQGTAEFIKTIIDGDKAISEANVSHQDMLDIQEQMPSVTDKATESVKRQTKAYDIEIYKLKQYEDLYKKGRDLTASVATDQERYNQKLEELDQLKPYVTIETYNRALEKAQKELKGTEAQTRQTTDEVSQLWVQAGRNIQSTLANSIFNIFDDGLKGMLKNTVSTLGRIGSEFLALKAAQSIGLAGMFGGAAGGIGGTGSPNILGSIASLGSNVLSSAKGGFGLSSLLSGGTSGIFSNAGGAGTAFIGGPGTALGGSGLGGLSSLGSSFGAAAGPVMAAFAVDAIGRALAGDKKLGGAEMIPVLGGFLAAAFGRGPYKFRQQSLQGEVSASGFDGDLTNVFKSKGGLFVANKHKSVTEQLTREQQDLFDTAITGFYKSAHGFAENLGFSADLVDTFTQTLQIKSEKNQKLTEEAITEMLNGIGDSLAKNVLPNVEDFRNAGEQTIQTLSRLSGEFSVLTNAASLLFNKSADLSKSFVKQFGFADRSAFLEKAGGADAFAANVAGFAQNFLTDDQRMKPVIESVLSERDKLGLSGINTREQFVGAVQSGKLNTDQMIFLLSNQAAIKTIFDYLDSKNQGLSVAEEAQAKAIDMTSVLNTISGNFNNEIERVTTTIGKLKDFSKELAASVLQIQPMTRNEAFQKLINYATTIANGGVADINDIKSPISTLSSFNNNDYSSGLDLARDRSRSASAINSLISISDGKQSDLAQQIIDLKNTMVAVMQDIADSSRKTADNIDSVTEGGSQMRTA